MLFLRITDNQNISWVRQKSIGNNRETEEMVIGSDLEIISSSERQRDPAL